MKTVAIIYQGDDWRKTIPFCRAKYRKCYELFYQLAKKNGLLIKRSCYRWFNGNGFDKGWTFSRSRWIKTGHYRPALIYDKCRLTYQTLSAKEKMASLFPFLNPPEFDLITSDKLITSLLFAKFSPSCFLYQKTDLKSKLNKLPGNQIVVKPNTGSGGEKIIFPTKSALWAEKIKIKPGFLVQEFINTSSGIKGLVGGVHDLRIIIIDKKISYGYIRTPARGSLLCNISQGGKMSSIKNPQIPTSVFSIIKIIKNNFSSFGPLIYSADFIFNKKQRPYLVELNSMPGIYFNPEDKDLQIKVYQETINLFKKICAS